MSGQNFAGQSLEPTAYNPTGRAAARWMRDDELQSSGLLDGQGVIIGQLQNGDLLQFNKDGHVMVFAPSGAGKGIGFVQPNLALYPASMVVLDPKGENAIMSAKKRAAMPGHEVIVLDPFNKTGDDIPKATYNPLGALTHASNDTLGPMVEAIADALIPVSGNEREPHWPLGAKKLASFLMWWMIAHEAPEQRHLVRLFELAHVGHETLSAMATAMHENPHPDAAIQRMCEALANWLIGRDEREFSFFESQLANNLGWIGDFVWSDVLAAPPSPPIDLKNPKAPKTIFLVLPFNRIERYRPWLRVMVADLLNSLYDRPGRVDLPVLFLLDEAYSGLGAMESLFSAAGTVRSAGGKICLVYQDVAQVKKLYGNDWVSLISNSGVTLFWGVNDIEAARMIADYAGYTMQPQIGNPNGIKEYLIPPEAVMRLPADRVLAMFRNAAPARLGRINVHENAKFKGKLDKNTTEEGDAEDYTRSEVNRAWVPVDLAQLQPRPSSGAAAPDDGAETIDRDFLARLSKQLGTKVMTDGEQFVVLNHKNQIVPLRAW